MAAALKKMVLLLNIILIVIGITMTIIGIIRITAKNDRAKKVDRYNKALKNYSSTAPTIATWQGTTKYVLLGQPTRQVSLEVKQIPVPIHGDTGGVDRKLNVGAYVPQSVIPRSQLQELSVAFSKGPIGESLTSTFQRSWSSKMYCDLAACTVGCYSEHESQWHCSESKLREVCKARYGANATYSSLTWEAINGACRGTGGVCGTCRYIGVLDTYCVQAIRSPTTGNYYLTSKTCFFPFTEFKYRSPVDPPETVTVQVRSEDDPYIQLELITSGSLDFGVTTHEQLKLALPLLIIGGLVIVCWCVLTWFMFVRTPSSARDQLRQEYEIAAMAMGSPPPTRVVAHPPAPTEEGEHRGSASVREREPIAASADPHVFSGVSCHQGHVCVWQSVPLPHERNYFSGGMCNLCDLPIVTKGTTRYLHCAVCEFDICFCCAFKSVSQSSLVAVCANGHVFREANSSKGQRGERGGSEIAGRKCAHCGSEFAEGQVQYTCSCRTRICRACFTSPIPLNSFPKRCPRGHPMVALRNQPAEYRVSLALCNSCGEEIVASLGFLHCRECEYDLCPACSVVPTAAVQGPASAVASPTCPTPGAPLVHVLAVAEEAETEISTDGVEMGTFPTAAEVAAEKAENKPQKEV